LDVKLEKEGIIFNIGARKQAFERSRTFSQPPKLVCDVELGAEVSF
jgi:hypothetical protein